MSDSGMYGRRLRPFTCQYHRHHFWLISFMLIHFDPVLVPVHPLFFCYQESGHFYFVKTGHYNFGITNYSQGLATALSIP